MANEPIYYTIPSRFLFATDFDEKEKHFMVSLCAYLGLHKVDRDDVDNMKEAVLNFVANQVEDWTKITDYEQLDNIIKANFKLLCEAQSFLKNREGSPQIYWEDVLTD
jgi:hypothetical protein